MRKRIIAMLCVCICILGLAACGADPKTVDYNGKSYDDLKTYAESTWSGIQALVPEQVQPVIDEIDGMSEAERIAVMEANEGLQEQYTLIKSWLGIQKEIGEFVELGDFTVTKSGKSTTTELKVLFEKRPVVLSVVYKNRDMSVESTTVDLVYTTGEKMQKAALNTVMGMGTVFVMLIVICLIISCFSFIPKIEKKLKESKENKALPNTAQEAVPETAPVPEVTMAPQTDDLELAAVIAAAIAASTGQSTDDFVVRSIKRR